MGSESDYWREPTESELVEIREQRARSDLLSKIMSDYLLKGYRMLADNCNVCGNVLLDDKKGRKFCVACEEVDSSRVQPNSVVETQDGAASSQKQNVKNSSCSSASVINCSTKNGNDKDVGQHALEVVKRKFEEAVEKLDKSTDTLECSDYVILIKNCAEALCALNHLNKLY